MIKEAIYQIYNTITENVLFNIINEQNENVLIRKVKELSESYILSIGAQTLIGSLALNACGISFSTSFPIVLALVVAKSFIATLNCAKTAIKATLNGAKTVIQTTAQKAASPFVRVASIINTIFQKVCASFKSFALSSYHLMKNTYPSSFRKFNYLPPSPPVIKSKKESIFETQELIEEAPKTFPVVKNLAPPKPILPLCDSQFIAREEDRKESYLLRGFPISPNVSKEKLQESLSQLKEKYPLMAPIILLKKENNPWIFLLLESGLDRPLKEPTSKRLGTTPTTLRDIPGNLLLEGIPVSLRSKL